MGEFQHNHRMLDQGWVDGFLIYEWEKSAKVFERVRNFSTRQDDIFLCSYPKTGTTWTQQIIWYVKHPEELAEGDPKSVDDEFLYIDIPRILPNGTYYIDQCQELPSPRCLKSHLPVRYFEEAISATDAPKYIVCVRNPKDTLVSMYNFYRMSISMGKFAEGWDEFFKLYEFGETVYGDIIDHFAGWWKLKDRKNVMIFMYEDMKRNPVEGIKDIAAFLGESLTDDQLRAIAEKTSFDKMKNIELRGDKLKTFDKKISPFFRKGEIGDWKNYFNEAQSRKVDEDVAKKLTPLGLTFTYEY